MVVEVEVAADGALGGDVKDDSRELLNARLLVLRQPLPLDGWPTEEGGHHVVDCHTVVHWCGAFNFGTCGL